MVPVPRQRAGGVASTQQRVNRPPLEQPRKRTIDVEPGLEERVQQRTADASLDRPAQAVLVDDHHANAARSSVRGGAHARGPARPGRDALSLGGRREVLEQLRGLVVATAAPAHRQHCECGPWVSARTPRGATRPAPPRGRVGPHRGTRHVRLEAWGAAAARRISALARDAIIAALGCGWCVAICGISHRDESNSPRSSGSRHE